MRRGCAIAVMACAGGAAQGDDFGVNPKGSFLLASGETPASPLIVELASVGLAPGSWAYLEVLGDWDCGGPCADNADNLLFLFSSTSELLATSVLHRVPGAIDVCPDFATANTYNGGHRTDIPEDFLLGGTGPISMTIEVPEGAAYVFIATHDSLYNDNSDPDGDLMARVEVSVKPCIADYNDDGSTNILDFVQFQLGFQGMDCRADCNLDGAWNILDFVCFQQVFVGGCG